MSNHNQKNYFFTPDEKHSKLPKSREELNKNKGQNVAVIRFWFNKHQKKAIGIVHTEDKEMLKNLIQDNEQKFSVEIIEIQQESFDRITGQLNRLTQTVDERKPGFVLCRRISPEPIEMEESKRFKDLLDGFHQTTKDIVFHFGGEDIASSNDYMLVYFNNLEDALHCSLKLRRAFDDCRQKVHACKVSMNIGISLNDFENAGREPFEKSIQAARRLSYINSNLIMLGYSLKGHFQMLIQEFGADNRIRLLTYAEEKFLNKLMDCLEQKWQDENFQVLDIGRHLNCSKSKIYRQMMDLIGQSPNHFIREYRLNRSIDLIRSRRNNISEIAFEAGFSSPSYFSHCFQNRFGLRPGDFMELMES